MNKDAEELSRRLIDLERELDQRTRQLTQVQKDMDQLSSQLEGLIARIDGELKIAHAIQRVLVPTDLPNIPGFEFSSKFLASPISGGDYIDIFELEDRFRFGIFMSSSSGHGMSALLLSVLMKHLSQVQARKGATADEVISLLRDDLLPHISERDSSSVFYSVYDRRNYEMSYCKTGDVIGYIYQAQEKNLVPMSGDSSPISKQRQPDLKTVRVSLNARDQIIVCSVGVTALKNQTGEPFGESRLRQLLIEKLPTSPHELRNEILFQVHEFTKAKDLERDVTVLVAEVKDKVLKLAKR